MNQTVRVDIPFWSIAKVFFVGLIFYLLFMVRDIIALFFIVLVFTASFRPIVNRWEKKIGRPLSVLALVALVILAVAMVAYLVVPPVIIQTKQLIENIPDILNKYAFLKNEFINEGISTLN